MISPDKFVSAGNDRTIREWDIADVKNDNDPSMTRVGEYQYCSLCGQSLELSCT